MCSSDLAKDAKLVQREVGEIFVSTVIEYLEAEHYDIEKIRQNVYERCLRAIRRLTGKQPMVLPLIIEVA